MKIVINKGCTSDSIIVDGKNINDLNESDILDYLLPKVKEACLNHQFNIREIIELFQYDDEVDLGYCETCFDNAYSTTYNI